MRGQLPGRRKVVALVSAPHSQAPRAGLLIRPLRRPPRAPSPTGYRAPMLRRMYDWCVAAAYKPYATWIMGTISFVESSFFPIPPDVMLIPMSLARPDRAYYYAFLCTWTSVAGGVLGYAIGALLYDSVGQWLISLYGYGDKVEAFREAYAEYGMWIILLKGLTPIPYKIVTITSGFAGYNLLLFILFSVIARGRTVSSCSPSCCIAMATGRGTSSRSGSVSGSRSPPSAWWSASSPPCTCSRASPAEFSFPPCLRHKNAVGRCYPWYQDRTSPDSLDGSFDRARNADAIRRSRMGGGLCRGLAADRGRAGAVAGQPPPAPPPQPASSQAAQPASRAASSPPPASPSASSAPVVQAAPRGARGAPEDNSSTQLEPLVGQVNADFKQSVEEQNAKWRELNAKNEKAAKDAAAASREAAEAFKNLSNIADGGRPSGLRDRRQRLARLPDRGRSVLQEQGLHDRQERRHHDQPQMFDPRHAPPRRAASAKSRP